MTTRVAIVGSRDADDRTLQAVRDYVSTFPAGTIVVSGGARGVDSTATQAARAHGLVTHEYTVGQRPADGPLTIVYTSSAEPSPVEVFVFEPGTSYRDALIFRNTHIAVDCTHMIAFTQGSRGGTYDAIAQAKRFRRSLTVIGDK